MESTSARAESDMLIPASGDIAMLNIARVQALQTGVLCKGDDCKGRTMHPGLHALQGRCPFQTTESARLAAA